MLHILFGHAEVLRYLANNKLKDNAVEVEALNAAVAALEKQIPSRVEDYWNPVCPSCETSTLYDCDHDIRSVYCPDCGQLLEWVDVPS